MSKVISVAILIVLVLFVGLAFGDPKDKSPAPAVPDLSDVQMNADWVGEVITPLAAKFVSCCDFFPKEELKDAPKKIELRFTVDEKGNRGKFDDSGNDVTISYPGGIRINECFGETLSLLKFPVTGKVTRHIYSFEITPEIEKAAAVLRKPKTK